MSHPTHIIANDADPEGGALVDSTEWEAHPPDDPAVPVKIQPREKLAAAELASWRTIIFAGTAADQSQQILGQDAKRHKAFIKATGVAGNNVILARQKQVSNTGNGYTLFTGDSITTEAASELWLVPTGTAVTVSIMEERYLS